MTWTEKDNRLVREIRTPDFMTSFNIVSRLVAPAEAMNHHPDVAFGWGYVRITLTTHDAGHVTDKDRTLAARFDEAVKPFGV
ncbi:4a-hydroxytetrahydrobiopterin dehydratase [Geothrix sp. 21YS21S-2]|uniref:4a-hydroxytetrahydrobiopterin dehydratase n=1 Tax=Geothrix sp. 21YS21S-2 TaxID=3068893 RepID=UPI0027B88B59|nr:4a-hydroxytetrahydrobiopterin dehydratase [Geothrix sp. 21YS21S-2]